VDRLVADNKQLSDDVCQGQTALRNARSQAEKNEEDKCVAEQKVSAFCCSHSAVTLLSFCSLLTSIHSRALVVLSEFLSSVLLSFSPHSTFVLLSFSSIRSHSSLFYFHSVLILFPSHSAQCTVILLSFCSYPHSHSVFILLSVCSHEALILLSFCSHSDLVLLCFQSGLIIFSQATQLKEEMAAFIKESRSQRTASNVSEGADEAAKLKVKRSRMN